MSDLAVSATDATRRDFLVWAATATAAVGTVAALAPFVDSLNPAADVLAVGTIEVDISTIAVGQAVTVTWRGKPVFIRHRSEGEIDRAAAEDSAELRDPATDASRVQQPQWLVVEGVCTHLGCVPLGQKPGDPRGDYAGWFCPCHGSHYDTSGRIRKGPAPLNLPVPPYQFLSPTTIRLGSA